ncbi:MAG: hypothetical protein ACI3XG_11695 [Faecousia sp.]
MKKYIFRIASLLLVLTLLLPVPARAEGLLSLFGSLFSEGSAPAVPFTPYSEMEYVRPDLEQLQALLDEVCRQAQGKSTSPILDAVFDFYDAYDWYFTASALADIRYSADLTDEYWEEEYNFCTASYPAVQQMLDSMYAALADSPCRRRLEWEFFGSGFFDSYGGQQSWDGGLVALMEQENQLISQYYTQCSQMTTLLGRLFFRADEAAQTLADLITVRNQMAECAGYDSYESFVNDYYYYRDYHPEEMAAYLDGIRDSLVPLYPAAQKSIWEAKECEISQALDFVRTAAQAMGGTIWEAFQLMEEGGLYDIEPGAHKFDSSFEVYLTSYQEPFLFMNPTGMDSDCLTLAHEFGHFCNDYASGGSIIGIDVSEIFSQGFEYLSLIDHPEAQELVRYKMADSLSTYVEQACYARFEQEMYLLAEPTVDSLCALYTRICEEYGMTDDYFSPWDFVTIPHFYTDPMYVSSYIISNDAALQLYQLECDTPGQGLARYQENLDTDQPYFMAFLEEAGLESPFAPGRLDAVAEMFRQFFSAA